MRTAEYETRELADSTRGALAPDERAALARRRAGTARRDYLVAHALMRSVVAERAGCDPAELKFRASPGGRPEPVWPPSASDYRLSISHGDGVALCGVAKGCDIGVDVESLRNVGPDPLALAETYCSARERAQIQAARPAERAERFLEIWTLKESIAKAMGLGFRLPFQEFTVRLPAEDRPPSVTFLPGVAGEDHAWDLVSMRPTREHVAAVALGVGSGE
ncbi:MAG TPA: 4'-phosphopantetheinyl transferase superfamily protein [Candidatus Eisenbacteria bacterium]